MTYSKKKTNHHGSELLIEHGKIQPQATDLEEVIIGTILNYEIPPDIFAILFSDIFYKDSHKKICQAIIELYESNSPYDMATVTEKLKKKEELELVGGVYYLALVLNKSRTPMTLDYNIRILHQYWVKRNTIMIGSLAVKNAYESDSDCFDVITELETGIDSMLRRVFVGKSTEIYESVKVNLDKIKKAMLSKTVNYFRTGMDTFDKIVKLTGNNVILIAAKNGSGKTKFVIQWMSRLFNWYPKKIGVLWYAMEDGDDKIVRNIIAPRVKLTDEQQLSKGSKLTTEQLDLITGISSEIANYNIEFVNEKTGIAEVGKHFRKFRSQNIDNDLNFLIIDNIMLLSDNQDPRYRNQNEKDDAISGEIDSWNIKTDRRTDPVVILIHHLTDEQLVKSSLNEAYRPREKHVKGSTRYRDIATMIMLMNRPAQYADLVSAYKSKIDIFKNLFLLDISKNRNGNTGLVRFFADLGINVFDEF